MEIRSLPEKEKDKLLLRLIAKDKVLTEHLHFKLLEDEGDLVQRHQKLHSVIDESIDDLRSGKKLVSKDAMLRMRKLNGMISHHFKVTKDVLTEIELRIHLLSNLPIAFTEGIFSPMHKFNEKLNVYFVKSALSVLGKYTKLHEDIQFDLRAGLNEVLTKIYKNKTAAVAEELGLPKEL
ncbi:hypothetical protein [Pedobacter frigoris]|uniref:hypothetical protein n=1 Tax=Pedobacter frigoris TaxID=2571272 RepID=UPI00292E649F|nr:hypothetical protein [Pedobacter frigoris]